MKGVSIALENESNNDIYIGQVGKKDNTNKNLPPIGGGVALRA